MRFWLLLLLCIPSFAAKEIAITIDDACGGESIDRRILAHLAEKKARAALFAKGSCVDSLLGTQLLARWSDANHPIANHTYEHRNLNAPSATVEEFAKDFDRAHTLLRRHASFQKWFRFPMLKEGATAIVRDGVRKFLRSRGYLTGHVTVDASDWYISSRMENHPAISEEKYRDYYLDHIADRAEYYRALGMRVMGHETPHTLLIHHNELNARFLGSLIDRLRVDGWKIINPEVAFADPIFRREPKTLPAGESLVWALAKESGLLDGELRYPAESDEYEAPKMDALGL